MFHKGDVVIATRAAGRTELVDAGDEARVVADSRSSSHVTIVRNGFKTPERWAASFWRKKTTVARSGDPRG